MPALKYSRQREAILSFLMTREDHPTADTVYANVREEFPNISLGTVYRNLSLLADLGEILKITTTGPDRFDAKITPHYHFVCEKCNAVLDIDMPSLASINREAEAHLNGEILGHTILFQGHCENCKKN